MAFKKADNQPKAPPAFVTDIGRLCAAWSFLELVTDRIVWGILGVDERIGSFITSPKDIGGRWKLIIAHGAPHVTAEQYATLKKINKLLEEVTADRNIIVHGQIFLLKHIKTGHEIMCARITCGASAGKNFPLSPEAIEIVINNTNKLSHAAMEIGNSKNWLSPPPNAEIVSDWPKPISELP